MSIKNGFTLIELLAVIVILAIIAIIATPIVLDLIEDSKIKSFKETINGITRAVKINSTLQVVEDEIEYKYENSDWEDENLQLEIDGLIPKYVEAKVNKEGLIRYAITDSKYCVIKEYDGKEVIKKIGNKNTEKMVEEQYCILDAIIATTSDYFAFDSKTGTITKYYANEKNDKSNLACPKDVVIPRKIDDVVVKIIGSSAFKNYKLMSVELPNTITTIESTAFYDNSLKEIIIPDSVKTIGNLAFAGNKLSSVVIKNTEGNVRFVATPFGTFDISNTKWES